MISIPITVAIFMTFVLVMQDRHYAQQEKIKNAEDLILDVTEVDLLKKEFAEYKKRVDTLTLKAGFKI